MAKQVLLIHQSLMKKLLDFLPCNSQFFDESDDHNIIQESDSTKVEELNVMPRYKISDIPLWDILPGSGSGLMKERSVIHRNYCCYDGRVRVGRGTNSKVEKKKCPRCSRWCKYYATKSTSIVMCPSCGKKFDPKSNLSSSEHKRAIGSCLRRQKQDHRTVSLQVRETHSLNSERV
ncbi:hypothetical protein HAX54_051689 [Datura stramonium]|uniref:Uncharacterized protein n=1 Tax=Datura stramonium TaxID=4076 RepID=A0ABS8SXY6_DATST|nr:hypothetical protein [Datura stramonium]